MNIKDEEKTTFPDIAGRSRSTLEFEKPAQADPVEK